MRAYLFAAVPILLWASTPLLVTELAAEIPVFQVNWLVTGFSIVSLSITMTILKRWRRLRDYSRKEMGTMLILGAMGLFPYTTLYYLAFALARQVDWIALSFVRTPDEMQELKRLIRDLSSQEEPVPVVAKIEKPEALDNIDDIIAAVDAIMVARGDLGIEIPAEEVPIAQKRIIEKCNREGVAVITATQMLESMIHHPRPTRAEASDVANAILDGTDAIMLSGETSIGAHPVEAARTMVRIAKEVEEHKSEVFTCPFLAPEKRETHTVADAVTHAARETAHDLDAAAIITPTASGYTAHLMSRYRPRSPIVAVTPSLVVQRQLMLYWGVTPLLAPRTDNTDEMIAHAVEAARERGLVKVGDTLVITAGSAGTAPGTTNLIKVHVVE